MNRDPYTPVRIPSLAWLVAVAAGCLVMWTTAVVALTLLVTS